MPYEMKKPQPKRQARNFYVHGYCGKTLPTGEFIAEKIISNGPWAAMGGIDIEIYQRTSRLVGGAAVVLHLVGRADPQGNIVLKVLEIDQQTKREKVLAEYRSHRDGVPEVKPVETA